VRSASKVPYRLERAVSREDNENREGDSYTEEVRRTYALEINRAT